MGERQFRAAGWTKAGRQEAGNPETGRQETGNPETSCQETGCPETGRQETGNPETGRQETGCQETGSPEAGQTPQRAVTGESQESRKSAVLTSKIFTKLDQVQAKIEPRWKPQGRWWQGRRPPALSTIAGFQQLTPVTLIQHGPGLER